MRWCPGPKSGEEHTCALLEVGASKSKKMQGSGRSRCVLFLPMQYAIDRRTKRVVQADQVRRTDRNRAYECPVCKVEVHYRRAIGLCPEPGFAHNAHVARQDCHLYHPSHIFGLPFRVLLCPFSYRPDVSVEFPNRTRPSGADNWLQTTVPLFQCLVRCEIGYSMFLMGVGVPYLADSARHNTHQGGFVGLTFVRQSKLSVRHLQNLGLK